MPSPTDVYFDSGLQGWIKKTARQEHWRVAGWYTIEDLVADGYVCYCKCRNRYVVPIPDEGCQNLFTTRPNNEQRKHFMSLVKRSFINHIMTLATRYPMLTEEPVDCSPFEDSLAALEGLAPPQSEIASILVALATAPAEIKEAIGRLLEDGLDGEKFLRTRLRREGTRVRLGRRALRETTPEYFARILGDSELPARAEAYILS